MLHRFPKNCCKEQFVIHNVNGNIGRIGAIEDGTCITARVAGVCTRRFSLDKQEVVLLTDIQRGESFSSDKPIFGNAKNGSADYELIPEYVIADSAGLSNSRTGAPRFKILSLGATTVDIFQNGILINTVALTEGQVTDVITTTTISTYLVQADGDILVQTSAGTITDTGTIFEPSDDLIGWSSQSVSLMSTPDGTTVSAYGTESDVVFNINATNPTTVFTTNELDGVTSTQDSFYDRRSAVRLQGSGLSAFSRADADGSNHTTFLPLEYMGDTHLIVHPSEFVAMVSDRPAVVTVTESDGTVSTVTLFRNSTNPLAPYSERIGITTGTAAFAAGLLLESDVPMHVVFQPKGLVAEVASDDETMSFSWNLRQ